MSSPFDALDGALSRAVMSVFGEDLPATLRPRTRSEYAEGADSARPERQIRGVFSESHDTAQLRGAAMNAEQSGVSRLSLQLAEFFIPAEGVRAIPYAIRQGDRVAFPGRPGAPVYTISDTQKTDTGDLNLILVAGQ
jgi:hypothetical protein